MCNSDAFVWAFNTTGTWLPINHLIHGSSGNQNPNVFFSEVEQLVNIQNLKEYKYTEKITPNAAHSAINKASADLAAADAKD